MELLKRVVIVIVGLALIAGVVFIIDISQKAQQQREKGIQSESVPPPDSPRTTEPLEDSGQDTSIDEVPVPDQMPFSKDSIVWRRIPETDSALISSPLPQGNPNPIFINAANRIIPAVVTIHTKFSIGNLPDDPTHEKFRERQEEMPDFFPGFGSGSGIIISEKGYILTNFHVVDKADSLTIILHDKREFSAEFIGADPTTDVALLRIETEGLPVAFMGNSDKVQIGEWVMAVGSPMSFSSTITAGIISALGRDIRIIRRRYSVENFIQTDAVINPGNSGGALVNLNGEVIGLNTAIATRTGMYQGYGFAIPTNLAMKIVDDLLEFGSVQRGLLGVTIAPVRASVAKNAGLPFPTGVLIRDLEPSFPAAQAGIESGDIILSLNGEEIVSVNDLQIKVARRRPGDRVDLDIWRNKKMLKISLNLGRAPVEQAHNGQQRRPTQRRFESFGIDFRDLTAAEKDSFETDSGVYIRRVIPGSPADISGLMPNAVIISLNGEIVENSANLQKQMESFGAGDVLRIIIRSIKSGNRIADRTVYLLLE